MSKWNADAASGAGCVLEALESRLLLSGDPALLGDDLQSGWLAAPPEGYKYDQVDAGVGLDATSMIYGVPEYFWHHGCGPTAAAMVLGYWDVMAYPNYYPGDASTQTTDVNEGIASKGDGADTTANPGTPGTGHVADYAYYNHINDYGWDDPEPDMSSLSPGGAHASDCIADFMFTSMSSDGSSHGSTWSDKIAVGMEGYADFVGYSASDAVYETWSGSLTWSDVTTEIDADRPLVFLVDSNGNGETDHFVPIIGYRTSPSNQYACYTTWSGDPGVHWFDWRGVADGDDWGVHSATKFRPCSGSPDLAGSYTNVTPEPLTWGLYLSYAYTIRNYGTEDAGAFTVSFYLSSNATISTSDILLGSETVGAISAGSTGGGTAGLTLPASPPTGFTESDDVWIGMIVDSGGAVGEGVEGNNRNLGVAKDMDGVRIDSRPDLYGTAFELSTGILNFGQTTADFTVHNGGQTDAGGFYVYFYLSENSAITTLDTYLAYRYVSSLDAGDDYDGSISLIVPTSDPFGGDRTYYIGMFVDSLDGVSEGDETNNDSEGVGLDMAHANYGVGIFHADFDHGDGGMQINNNPGWAVNPGLWHTTAHRSYNGAASMYYGREKFWDYDAGDNAGFFQTKTIDLPDEPASLSFRYWAQTDPRVLYDRFRVELYDVESGSYTSLLAKGSGLSADTGGSWAMATADLTDFADKQVRLRFTFDTIDSSSNDYEGLYYDDIVVWAANNSVSREAFRNLRYDENIHHDASMSFVGDHDTLVFNEEQSGGTFLIYGLCNGSAVNPAVAVYDYETGEMLAIDGESGTDPDAQILLSNSGNWNSYLVEVWDTEEDSTGELDISINGSGAVTAWVILVEADGHGSYTDQHIDPTTDTDCYRVTAPAQASGTLDITVRTTGGTLIPRLQVWRSDGDDKPDAVNTTGGAQFSNVVPGDVFNLSVSDNDFVDTGDFEIDVDFSTALPGTMTSAEGFAYFHRDGISHDTQTFSAFVGGASISPGSDVDSFYFAGDTGWTGTYVVQVNRLSGTVDPVVAVYDATTGAQLGFDDDSGGGVNASLSLTLNELTRYIVAVADDNSADTGDVEVIITAPGTRTPTSIGLNVSGDGERVGLDSIGANDTDCYRFLSPADTNGDLVVLVAPADTLDAAVILFDAAGNEIAKSYLAAAGANETITVSGLSPSTYYYVSVLAKDYATTGAFDIYVDFDLIVPDELPGVGRWLQAPNKDGNGSRDVGAIDDWIGWALDSDVVSAGGVFTVTSSGSRVPVLGLYDLDTGQRLAWNSNPTNASMASITYDVVKWHRYELIIKPKSGATGSLTVEMDLASPSYAAAPAIDAGGHGTASGVMDDEADIDYYRLVAPPSASGDLTIRLYGADPSLASTLELFDHATGAWLDDAYTYSPGGEVVMTCPGIQPGQTYDLAVYSSWFESGAGGYSLDVQFSTAVPGTMTSAQADGWAYFDHDGTVHDSLSMSAFISPGTDVDSYIFAPQAGWTGTHVITVTAPAGSAVKPVLAIYDGTTGAQLGFASSGGGATATLSLSLTALTEYVIAVADDNSAQTGNLDITIDGPGFFAGEWITLNAAGDGSDTMDSLSDNDTNFYRFTAPADTNGSLDVTVSADVGSLLAPAFALFDAGGGFINHGYTSTGGGAATKTYAGLTPGATYYLSVMAYRHASTGAYDVNVDFDLIVPDAYPGGSATIVMPTVYGDRQGSFTVAAPGQWWGYTFDSDVNDADAVFTITGSGGLKPIVGLYDAATGNLVAWDTNPGNADVVVLTASINRWTLYHIVTTGKAGTTGTAAMEIDLNGPFYVGSPTIDADGQGSVVGGSISPDGDIDYYRLLPPAAASGDVTIRMHNVAAALRGWIVLFDETANTSLTGVVAPGLGADAVLTYGGIDPTHIYSVGVSSYAFAGGTGTFDLDIDFDVSVPGTMTSAEADGWAYFDHDGTVHDSLSMSAIISPGTDIDSYIFAGQMGWSGKYVITVTAPLGSAVNPVVAAYDGTTGAQIGFASSGGGATATLTVGLTELTEYVIAVADDDSTDTGALDITIDGPGFFASEWIALDDAGDGSDTGDSLADNDTNFYRFTAPIDTNGNLEVSVGPRKGSLLAPAFGLFDSTGLFLGHGYTSTGGGTAARSFSGLTPGATYYVSVMAYRHASTGAYNVYVDFDVTLKVISCSVDDGDVRSLDEPLVLAVRFSHAVDAAGLDVSDFELRDGSGSLLTPDSWAYIGPSEELIVRYSSLGFDKYAFRVLDTVTDIFGSRLDGDGDGVPGGDFRVRFMMALPGDTDLDGDVDFYDYLTVKADFGMSPAAWRDGDFDDDDDVDFYDFLTVKANFGRTVSAGLDEVLPAAGPATSEGGPAASGGSAMTAALPPTAPTAAPTAAIATARTSAAGGRAAAPAAIRPPSALRLLRGERTVSPGQAELVPQALGPAALRRPAIEQDMLDVLSAAKLLPLAL